MVGLMKKVFLLSILIIFLSAGNSFATTVCSDFMEETDCADLTYYKNNGTIVLRGAVTGEEFNFIYSYIYLVQNSKQLEVIPYRSSVDEYHALIECPSIDYCWGDVKKSVVFEAEINTFPSWFNVNQSFTFYYGDVVIQETAPPVTTTTTTIPITIINHLMTKDPKPNTGCETPLSVSNFSTQDETAWVWFRIAGLKVNNIITRKFYGPDSVLYSSQDSQVLYTDECDTGGIYIKGHPAENMPGNWHVDVYYDGIKQFTDTFTITSPTTTTSIQPTTSTTTSTIAVKADFYGSPTTGVAPLIVQFTNLSTGNISDYEWDFGDGSTISTEQNPSHTYENAGTYSMSLTVTGSNGTKDTKVKESYIIITSPQLCPFRTSLSNTEFIDTLHNLRDKRFTNLYGKLLTAIFYRNAAEVNSILSAHPELQIKLRELVEENIEIAQDLIDYGTANLPQRNADEITCFLNEIAKDGSLKMKFYTALTIKGIEYRYLTNGVGVRIE
jgi:PKD repeat protein